MRLCLYATTFPNLYTLIDFEDVKLALLPPAPTPEPAADPDPRAGTGSVARRRPRLDESRAAAPLRHAASTRRTGYHGSCTRASSTKVRCRVRWRRHKRTRYAGTVRITVSDDKIRAVPRVRRKR